MGTLDPSARASREACKESLRCSSGESYARLAQYRPLALGAHDAAGTVASLGMNEDNRDSHQIERNIPLSLA